MGLERNGFAFGSSVYPLTTSTDKWLLDDVDSAVYHTLNFLCATFESYFGARLRAQAALSGFDLQHAVVTPVTIDPTPYLLGDQFGFPIFALYRKKDVWDEHTIAYDKSSSIWEFAYILPPMTAAQAKELQPILRAVSVTMRRVIHMGQDAAYNGGESVWTIAGVQKARVVECVYGGYERIDNLDEFYRALTGTISVLEREQPVPSEFDNFAGADVEVDLGSQDGTSLADFDDFATNAAPTVTSITPTSGPTSGNTLVTITGTGFRVGTRPIVLFDGATASAATVVNATTATCRSPAHAAYPSFVADLIYIAADGQRATLPAAFTFNAP